jgi:hypothetical protein
VADLFAYIENQKKFYRILADAGRLNDFPDLAQGCFARGIEQRLIEAKRLSKLPEPEQRARCSRPCVGRELAVTAAMVA